MLVLAGEEGGGWSGGAEVNRQSAAAVDVCQRAPTRPAAAKGTRPAMEAAEHAVDLDIYLMEGECSKI